MKKLNQFFFGKDKISKSDATWFYGVLTGAIIIQLFLLWVTY